MHKLDQACALLLNTTWPLLSSYHLDRSGFSLRDHRRALTGLWGVCWAVPQLPLPAYKLGPRTPGFLPLPALISSLCFKTFLSCSQRPHRGHPLHLLPHPGASMSPNLPAPSFLQVAPWPPLFRLGLTPAGESSDSSVSSAGGPDLLTTPQYTEPTRGPPKTSHPLGVFPHPCRLVPTWLVQVAFFSLTPVLHPQGSLPS